jgi:hypothetical protein
MGWHGEEYAWICLLEFLPHCLSLTKGVNASADADHRCPGVTHMLELCFAIVGSDTAAALAVVDQVTDSLVGVAWHDVCGLICLLGSFLLFACRTACLRSK